MTCGLFIDVRPTGPAGGARPADRLRVGLRQPQRPARRVRAVRWNRRLDGGPAVAQSDGRRTVHRDRSRRPHAVLRRLEGQGRAREFLGDLVPALPGGNSRPDRAAEKIPRPARRDRDLRGRDFTRGGEAVRDREEDQLPDRDDQRRSCRRGSPASPRCRRPSSSIRTDRLPTSGSASCNRSRPKASRAPSPG